jgi:hypothetical protein
MHIDFLKSHKDFARCKSCAYICMLTIDICCTGREAEKELENDPLVGPPPPSVVAEAESANDAERFEEVTRMVARDIGNAYDLLGVKPDVNPSVLKKRYWKLSLLVHPDKCSHPQAHEAFMALNQAFKDLQDPSKVCFLPSALGQKCLLLV